MPQREQQETFRRRASTLGANLALAREAAGLTQGDVAERAGTSRATIAQIESGEGDPRLSTLGAIADALGVGPFVLLLGKHDIEKLVALAQKPKEFTLTLPDTEEIALLDELAGSHLAADRRRAARMSSGIASERGFGGVGAAVGAAIGTTLMPGLGTIVGAFLGAVGARKKKGRQGNEDR
jgi:transcriptional regulator with XRE-family HTH domain